MEGKGFKAIKTFIEKMCVLHVFDCKDCSTYTRIPVLDYQDLSATIFTDVICRVDGCQRKSLAYRLIDSGSYSDCHNVLCRDTTCRLVSVPKSCQENWSLDPSNVWPVRVNHSFQGN